ncbi:uncharacterized protein LOC115887163 [Sitophilus oryzae]|uniref:Uncharacterized protein LOC115887163 n=1 Tax=Sitophilus oryzae TaxID=7048 RepID=A0A6J2YGE4_SITOR|nr:uncharacterized protein LOC115887163 [Sitophilus oryzae]
MGGCRCSYKNCTNTTKTTENIHFFHYPVKHRDRCIVWIENACKKEFYNLEEDQLRNKVVCEQHFDPRWFPNPQRKRLLQNAVPTLDGDAIESLPKIAKTEPDNVPFFPSSNQYKDIKVVPANDDGTVFVLDTENMFTVSPKIESYVIKNGVLVPTNSNNAPSKNVKNLSNQPKPVANINACPGIPGPSKPPLVKQEIPETCEPTTMEQEDDVSLLIYDDNINESSDLEEKKTAGASLKNLVSRNYLRKIKQHSRDIASIKRMLKQKRIAEEKPSRKSIIDALRSDIPPSLLTVISLILGEKNELNDEDVEFFTTIHRSSSDVYQLLSDKYKWNLPSVDIVEGPE